MTPEEYYHYLKGFFFQKNCLCEYYLIAGEVFQFFFPSKETKENFGSHFPVSKEKKAFFTIYIWDQVSPNGGLIKASWNADSYENKGMIKGFNNSDFFACYEIGSQALSFANLKTKEGFFWTPDLKKLPFWEKGSPLRNLLHTLLPIKNKYFVHGAAVATNNKSALIVGKGGSGKSTTALSCLKTNLNYLGDDYCIIDELESTNIWNLYQSAKIKTSPETKSVISVDSKKIIQKATLSALIFPKIASVKDPILEPCNRSILLREMAASTIFQLPGKNKHLLGVFSLITKKIPCFSLKLSKELKKNAALIKELLK